MKGFTLIEVVVTTLILAVAATILLPSFNSFGAGLSVRREAQQIALSIREAQANAFAVRGFDHDNSSLTPLRFNPWGIYFDNASDASLVMFVDSDVDGIFDSPSEVVRTIPISSAVKIHQLCARLETGNAGDDICSPGGLSSLTILYQRPNPDVTLKADNIVVSDVEIVLRSSKGNLRTIIVWSSGQISVE